MFDISKAHLALAILRRLTSDRDIGLHLKGWTSIQPNKIRQLAMGKFEHLPNVKQLPCSSTLIDRTCACLQRCWLLTYQNDFGPKFIECGSFLANANTSTKRFAQLATAWANHLVRLAERVCNELLHCKHAHRDQCIPLGSFRGGYTFVSLGCNPCEIRASFPGGTATSVTILIDLNPFVRLGWGVHVFVQSSGLVHSSRFSFLL